MDYLQFGHSGFGRQKTNTRSPKCMKLHLFAWRCLEAPVQGVLDVFASTLEGGSSSFFNDRRQR